MDIRAFFKKMDRTKKIGIGALAVLTAGALCLSAYSQYRTERQLAEEAAAWEAELAAMAAEAEAVRLEKEPQERRIETIGLTGDGQQLLATDYLPTRIADRPITVELNAEIRKLGPGAELPEGAEIILTLPEDKPASVMIWRDPIGEETPPDSVNYTREETENGIRCIFTVAYGSHASLDYEFDIKLDDHNQGRIGFTAVRPADAEVQEMTHG